MIPTGLIILLLVAGTALALYAIWNTTNSNGYQKRALSNPVLPKQARHIDVRKLTPKEEKILQKATNHARQGQVHAGALLLEQAGLFRQCISLFEEFGFIDEAASVLMRMQRPHRAGFIYARHGKWDQAANCFKSAGLSAEAGRCLRESERYDEASEQFIKANRLEDAAGCLTLAGKLQAAGKIYLKLKQLGKAKSCYDKIASNPRNNAAALKFDDSEIDFFTLMASQGPLHTIYIDVLAQAGRLLELILGLMKSGNIQAASALYLKSNTDLGPLLMSETSSHTAESRALGELFQNVAQFKYAGMVYEQAGDFARAAQAFEQAEDWDRASYCYDRCGEEEKASALRAKMSKEHSNASRKDVQISSFVNPSDESTRALQPAAQAPLSFVPSPPVFKNQKSSTSEGFFSIDPLTQNEQVTHHFTDDDRILFHACKVFADLDYDQRERIWKLGTIELVAPDSVVIDWGDEPAGFYLVLEGQMAAILANPRIGEDSAELAPCNAGDIFGELWLLAEHPASIRFVASKRTRLFFIERSKFTELLDTDGSIARKVYKHFTHRLLAKMLNPSKPQDIRRAS